jgi:hypothetical protein
LDSHFYMGITCHWIDDNWVLQKRVLAYRVFDERHTANNIYKLIKQILEEYLLESKIFSISFDNASNNTASINDLKQICEPNLGGKYFHVRCACHVLNLCVQDGLRALEFFVSPIKKAIKFLWTHPQIMKDWGKFCKINGVKPKKFSKDVPTRWNSTYELLNESFEYRQLLCKFITNHVSQVQLYPQHWDICAQVLEVLKVFNDATYTLSGVYYPTSHLFLIECLNIVGVMQENENNELLHDCISSMKKKWLDYFEDIPPLFLAACVFDPRCKFEGLSDYLFAYYSCLNITKTEIDITSIIFNVRKDINDLYSEFISQQTGQSSSQLSTQVQNEPSSRINMGDRILLQRHKKPRGSSGNSEFDIYLTTIFEFGENSAGKEFPVLEWWHRHENTFPTLALLAKQILAVPISTVSVERAFSAGGNILDDTRSSMNPESLEAQTCMEDWVKASLRQQEYVREQSDDDFFELTTDGTSTTTSCVGSD